MKTKHLFILLILLAVAGCAITPVPPVPVEPTDTSECGAACAHLRTLRCREGQPLWDGTTCESFCKQTQQKGHGLSPSCIVTIMTCGQIETKCSLNRTEQ